MSFIEPVKTPTVEQPIRPVSSATLPRPSNAVRIYVPFGGVQQQQQKRAEEQLDITTRVIDVKSNTPVPELVQVTSAESSQYSTLSSVATESAVPTSPRKSTLVRMGTKISSDALIREKMRLQEVSFSERIASGDPSGAYVVGKFDSRARPSSIMLYNKCFSTFLSVSF